MNELEWTSEPLTGADLDTLFLAWAIAEYAALRRRDRAAGKTYQALGWPRDGLAIGIGAAAIAVLK